MESKVTAKDLKVGMFVADLDRPWIDTPFLIQGFLIEDEQQIRQIQRHCEFVVVDMARSVGFSPAVGMTESNFSPAPRIDVVPAKAELAPVRPMAAPALTDTAPGLLEGLVSRMKGMLRRGEPLPEIPADTPDDRPRPVLLPPGVTPTFYRDIRSVEEEVERARSTFENSAEMLHRLADDVWAGRPVSFERCEEVVDEMVESMVRNPDALMWVARLRERDRTVYGHGLQVAVYLVAFGGGTWDSPGPTSRSWAPSACCSTSARSGCPATCSTSRGASPPASSRR
jgi:hypothetical protein